MLRLIFLCRFSPVAGIILIERLTLLVLIQNQKSFSPVAGIILIERKHWEALPGRQCAGCFSPVAGIILIESRRI